MIILRILRPNITYTGVIIVTWVGDVYVTILERQG